MTWTAPQNAALIIVDVQNDFCPGGALEVPEGDQVAPLINELRAHFDHIILTQDWHPADHRSFASQHPGKEPFSVMAMSYGQQVLWPDHCVQETRGAEFHPELVRSGSDEILRKGTTPEIDSYSGFFENDGETRPRLADGRTLSEYLRDKGIDTVVLSGLAYDFCVGWHALDARKEGFRAVVVEDATRPIDMPLGSGGTSMEDMVRRLKEADVELVVSGELQKSFQRDL